MIAIAVRRGSRDISADDKRIASPGTTRGPRPRPRRAAAATWSGVGVPGARFVKLAARPGVCTAPATHATTSTPDPRRLGPEAFGQRRRRTPWWRR